MSTLAADALHSVSHPAPDSLAHLARHTTARVLAIHASDADLTWLSAIGLFAGQRVRVLRRAAFGGPLHVRTASGGEFAIARALAAMIEVARVRSDEDDA